MHIFVNNGRLPQFSLCVALEAEINDMWLYVIVPFDIRHTVIRCNASS